MTYCSATLEARISDQSRKIHQVTRNISVGDIVILHDGGMFPTQWPLGKMLKLLLVAMPWLGACS